MGRFRRSWDLFKTSFSVIKQDKELLWMPILSFVATAVAIAGIAGIGVFAGIFQAFIDSDGNFDAVTAAFTFAVYLTLAFIQVFFHAATVAGANERLSGGDPTLRSALGKAGSHIGRLFLWSLVVATVNVILQALNRAAGQRGNMIGQIVVSLVGGAWNLATYFVVPVLLFEDKGVGGGMKGSVSYFKKTWGETIIGDAGIGFAGGIVTVLILVTGGLSAYVMLNLLGVIPALVVLAAAVLTAIAASIMFTVAAAVYKTALYRFASGAGASGPFNAAQMGAQWRQV